MSIKKKDNAPVPESILMKEDDDYILPDPDDPPCGDMRAAMESSVLPRGMAMARRSKGRGAGAGNSLPVINVEPHMHMTFRYERIGTGNTYPVTVGDLARCFVAAASGSTYRYMVRTFRVKHVTIRGSTGSVGEAASVSLRYVGQNTNEVRLLDQTIKIDNNAVVSRAPPRMSLASFWHDVESAELSTEVFDIVYFGSGQLYVDVSMEILLDVDRYISFTLSGGTGLATGGVYKGALSGTNTSGLAASGGTRL
jgi:hypothetical protein